MPMPLSPETMDTIGANLKYVVPALVVLLGLLVLYLVLIMRAIIQMLRHDASPVLLTFSFLSLIPFPLILVLGIMILIIWRYHKRDLLSAANAGG